MESLPPFLIHPCKQGATANKYRGRFIPLGKHDYDYTVHSFALVGFFRSNA